MITLFPRQLSRTLLHITDSACTRGPPHFAEAHLVHPGTVTGRSQSCNRGLGHDGPPKTSTPPAWTRRVSVVITTDNSVSSGAAEDVGLGPQKSSPYPSDALRTACMYVRTNGQRGHRQNATRAISAFRCMAGSTFHINELQTNGLLKRPRRPNKATRRRGQHCNRRRATRMDIVVCPQGRAFFVEI